MLTESPEIRYLFILLYLSQTQARVLFTKILVRQSGAFEETVHSFCQTNIRFFSTRKAS